MGDNQWERSKDLLPGRKGALGVTARDNRLFVEAVLYRYRARILWRDLPERFSDFRVVHTRLGRWAKRGVWQRVFEALASDADSELRENNSSAIHNEYPLSDSTIACAHPHSAGAKGGMPGSHRLQQRGIEYQDLCLGQPCELLPEAWISV